MPYDEVRRFWVAVPFIPFRIRTTDGQQFDIRHPEMLALFRHVAIVGVVPQGGQEAKMVSVAVIHIVTVEPLP